MLDIPHPHAIRPMKAARKVKGIIGNHTLPKPKAMPMKTASVRSTASKPVKPLKRAARPRYMS